MADLAMIMPMAGRGSRFARGGEALPKPLLDLAGRPFFWWAAESLRRAAPLREMVFVVLADHVRDFDIDRRILDLYPRATIVSIPDVTSGAAETALIGMRALAAPGPVAVNDSDHAFRCPDLAAMAEGLGGVFDGGLLCFRADSPAYSYALLDEIGRVAGTIEKRVASPYAIAGCYLFAGADQYRSLYDDYRESCGYDELFVSGLYNLIAARGGRIGKLVAERHLSFGTPEERARLDPAALSDGPQWLAA